MELSGEDKDSFTVDEVAVIIPTNWLVVGSMHMNELLQSTIEQCWSVHCFELERWHSLAQLRILSRPRARR